MTIEGMNMTARDPEPWPPRPEVEIPLLLEGDPMVRRWYAWATGGGVLLLVLVSLIRGSWLGWLPIALVLLVGVSALYMLHCASERLFANHRSVRYVARPEGGSYD